MLCHFLKKHVTQNSFPKFDVYLDDLFHSSTGKHSGHSFNLNQMRQLDCKILLVILSLI